MFNNYDNFIKNLILKFPLLGYFFIFLGSCFIILATIYHPIIGDDLAFKFNLNKNSDFFEYFNFYYFNHTGRISQIIFTYLIFKYDFFLLLFKASSYPIYIITCFLMWKIITNNNKFNNIDSLQIFSLFSICLWLSLPALDETIIWSCGSVTYLFSIFYFFNLIYFLNIFLNRKKIDKIYFKILFISIIGFLLGSSSEQLSIVSIIFLFFLFFQSKSFNTSKKLLIIISILSVIIGFCVLFFAPGNYQRMGLLEERKFISKIITFILYLFSGYFKLGDEDSGSNLWLSIFLMIYIINPYLKYNLSSLKESFLWLFISILTLLVMFPIVDHTSTRTTFYAIFFLYVFTLKFSYNLNKFTFEGNHLIYKNLIFLIISCVFFFDGFVGYLSNKSLNNENIMRMEIIDNAVKNDLKTITLPVFATIPSRLTYIMPPHLEKHYLKYYEKENIKIYFNRDLYSNQINPLKNLKFNF